MRQLIESDKISEINELKCLKLCLEGIETFIKIQELVSSDWFFVRQNKVIYEVYNKIYTEGFKLIDSNIEPLLSADLLALKQFRELAEVEVELEDLDSIVKILEEKNNKRLLFNIERDFKRDLESKESSDVIFNRLNENLIHYGNKQTSEEEFVGDFLKKEIPDPSKVKKLEIEDLGVTSGIKELDEVTLGYGKGQLIEIAGLSSSGKSTFALQGILANALLGKLCVVYSLEDNKQEMNNRLLAGLTEVDNYKIRRRDFRNREDRERFIEGYDKFLDLPIIVDDSVEHTPFSIYNSLRKIQLKHGEISLVMVDYVQCISNEREELEKITQAFQRYAKILNVPIILVSQFNRNLEYQQRDWKEPPRKSDLRGTGVLEQAAYKILSITTEPNQELKEGDAQKIKRSIIWITKNKSGQVGMVKTLHELTKCKFKYHEFSLDTEEQEQKKSSYYESF